MGRQRIVLRAREPRRRHLAGVHVLPGEVAGAGRGVAALVLDLLHLAGVGVGLLRRGVGQPPVHPGRQARGRGVQQAARPRHEAAREAGVFFLRVELHNCMNVA